MNPPLALGIAPLAHDLERLEASLRAAVRHDDPFLAEVGSHLIGAGGKRIRPMLTMCAGYAAQGGDHPVSDEVITGGVACELVHLGSLHHDDVIDEAETRRGVPSVNARWSNIVAILSGDFLLARASSLAASLGAEVAALLADTIGELCRGQVLELQHLWDVTRTEEDYTSAIEGKTASLFATSCRIGGMVSGVDEPTLDALTRYGQHVGLCFQIVDDCLDLVASEDVLGKPAGQDLVEGVYTLPVIYALQHGGDELAELLGGPLDDERRDRARKLATANGAVESALAVARDHAKKAREALEGADALDAEVTSGMGRLVDQLVSRDR